MKAQTFTILILAVLIAGCGPVSLTEIVSESETEILYTDVINAEIPANEISYFGVMFGASEDDVRALHGQPDSEQEFAFGRTKNIEYSFGKTNATTVLYHFDRGSLQSVLITNAAQSIIKYDSLLGDTRQMMYSTLGVSTRSQDLDRERMFIYDELGYEIFTKRNIVDRIYFTTPNRGIAPAGQDKVNETNSAPIICAQVITYAQNASECAQFPTPCDIPSGWDVIKNPTSQQQESCEFRAE
jgi:uncharacterized protein YbdZ (MbtH family)